MYETNSKRGLDDEESRETWVQGWRNVPRSSAELERRGVVRHTRVVQRVKPLDR